jgi:transglutaminase-like putative cysteine protease
VYDREAVKWSHKWVARSPIDGLPVTMRRAQFDSQAEQIGFLRKLVTAYRSTHTISALARDIVFRQASCPPKKKGAHALAVAGWVQRNVTYVNEGEETFQTPLATLRFGYGDCDDLTTLIASLVESLGIPCELVALGWAERERLFGRPVAAGWANVLPTATYRHIFPRAVISSAGQVLRVPLDATLDQPVEWRTDPVALAASRGVKPTTLVL